jgi:hypothetical protein
MADPTSELTSLADDLEQAAARLRAGELDTDGAAALVDECARLASRAAAELDRHARAGAAEAGGPTPGQDSLLP